jgi:hypothetical protein
MMVDVCGVKIISLDVMNPGRNVLYLPGNYYSFLSPAIFRAELKRKLLVFAIAAIAAITKTVHVSQLATLLPAANKHSKDLLKVSIYFPLFLKKLPPANYFSVSVF